MRARLVRDAREGEESKNMEEGISSRSKVYGNRWISFSRVEKDTPGYTWVGVSRDVTLDTYFSPVGLFVSFGEIGEFVSDCEVLLVFHVECYHLR